MASIGEQGFALGLLLASAFALTSKVCHEFYGFFRWFFLLCVAIFVAVFAVSFIEQAQEKGWSHLPSGWHKLMVALNISQPAKPLELPMPHFVSYIQQLRNLAPYKDGTLVDGIHWNQNLKEYMFRIQNGMDIGEINNFKQRMYLPFSIVKAEIVSSQGSDGVDLYLGDGSQGSSPPPNEEIEGGKIIRILEGGTNMITISATRMLPEGSITVKLIGNLKSISGSSGSGVMIYGSEYVVAGQSGHYGRMFRYMAPTDSGDVIIGPEMCKKGSASIPIRLMSVVNVDKHRREQDVPLPTVPPEDSGQRLDDQCP
jgi:hypothetical protein